MASSTNPFSSANMTNRYLAQENLKNGAFSRDSTSCSSSSSESDNESNVLSSKAYVDRRKKIF